MTRPTRTGARPNEEPPQPYRLASSWRLGTFPKRLALYPVLALLALGDAYVFWNTLQFKLFGQSEWVLILVIALSVAAVVTCHQAGQTLRHRHEGYGGSVAFVTLLVAFWLSIGLLIAWIRATSPVDYSDEAEATEVSLSLTSTNVELAALMLVLFLATGALAMGHGYKYGDPAAQLEEEVRRRIQAHRRLKEELEYAESRAQLALDQTDEVRKRLDEDERRSELINRASADVLDDEARREMSVGVGDPTATSGFQDKPGQPFTPPEPDEDDYGYGYGYEQDPDTDENKKDKDE